MGKRGKLFIISVILTVLLVACLAIPDLSPYDDSPSLAIPTSVAHPTPTPFPPTPQIPPPTVQNMFLQLIAKIPAENGYGYVAADEFKREIGSTDKPFIIDVRDPDELMDTGYIEGAVNIPIRILLRELDKLPGQQAKILLYSNHGNRSGLGIAALLLLGYTDVHDLAGGLSSWVHISNYPVVTGALPAPAQVLTPQPVISDQATYDMLDSFLTHLPSDYYQVEPNTVSQELDGPNPPTLVDMNLPSDDQEFGYIKGSLKILFLDFFNHVDMLPSKDSPIVIYAVGGGHSSILVMGLREMGYTQVFSLKGGIIGWHNAGLPVLIGSGN